MNLHSYLLITSQVALCSMNGSDLRMRNDFSFSLDSLNERCGFCMIINEFGYS